MVFMNLLVQATIADHHYESEGFMEQIEMFQIDSPCRGVCESSAKGFCKGCLRSRDERFHWFSMTNEDKFKVLELCKRRRQRLLKARMEHREVSSTKALPYGMDEEPVNDLFTPYFNAQK